MDQLDQSKMPLAFGIGMSSGKKSKRDQKVERDMIGTIYFDSMIVVPKHMTSANWVIKDSIARIKSDVSDLLKESDGSSHEGSVASFSSEKFVPRAILKILMQFVELLESNAGSGNGFISYYVETPTEYHFKFHWSRAYIRNEKSITVNGLKEYRKQFQAPSWEECPDYSYSISLTAV